MAVISIHPMGDAAHMAHGFSGVQADSMHQVAQLIVDNAWSPCVWEGGRRKKDRFIASDFFVFDFDSGATLADMKYWCEIRELAHVIGTTKSHQKEKRSGDHIQAPCDRFRVVIPADVPCTDRALFESNMRRWVRQLGCDKSCSDAARFYFPCVEIHAIGEGYALPWTPEPAAEVKRMERIAAREERMIEIGVIPSWIRELLRHGVPSGGRHQACCRLGAKLHRFGFSDHQIIELVMSSPLSEIGATDVERAVGWGVRNAHRA